MLLGVLVGTVIFSTARFSADGKLAVSFDTVETGTGEGGGTSARSATGGWAVGLEVVDDVELEVQSARLELLPSCL